MLRRKKERKMRSEEGLAGKKRVSLFLQRDQFSQDNPPDQSLSPCKLWCIYAFIHLPVTACVRSSVKKLLRLEFVSKCSAEGVLHYPSHSFSLSLPFCFFLSVSLWTELSLGLMGSSQRSYHHHARPSPSCGSGSVPALIIDPSGPSRHIQQWVEQNHH